MNKKVWLSPPHMEGDEKKFIERAFEENYIAPIGSNVDGFENDIENYLGDKIYVTTLNSGTAAIHLALQLLGVKEGDVVLCQSFTFSATVNPVLYLKAKPVFIDSETDTWNMCPELLEKTIKDSLLKGIQPKAILAVHLYGMPYQIEKINQIASKYKIPIIEDSAEALGSLYKAKKCGTFGDYSVLSFNGNKIITTSGGGALISKKREDKERAIYLATHSKVKGVLHYQHEEVGYNYRLSNVLAGIGRGQMQVLEKRVASRRANYDYYYNELSKIKGIGFLEEPSHMYSNRWLTCILFETTLIRDEIITLLQKNNIESRPLWKPLHLQPVFSSYEKLINGVSENLFKKGLCLPSGSNLKQEDLDLIVSIIKNHMDA